jgi:heat shock protein HslJ
VTTVVGAVTLTAEFDEDALNGSTGVNRFRAPYRLDGPMISVGTAVMTRMAALRPELGEQETHYLAALALARSARITGDLLHLYREGDTIAVTFTRSTVE